VEFVHVIDMKALQTDGLMLFAYFLECVRGVKRCNEVSLKHWRRVYGMFVDKTNRRFVVKRSQ